MRETRKRCQEILWQGCTSTHSHFSLIPSKVSTRSTTLLRALRSPKVTLKLALCIFLAIFTLNLRPWKSAQKDRWPYGPFRTDGRWIKNARGEDVRLAGTNWPGHLEIMIPEGLQYASAEFIARKIKSLGMNSVRLTFAIEMIDDIYVKGHDTTLSDSITRILGNTKGTALLSQILAHNPLFKPTMTRLEVFTAVANALENEEIYLLLDNHVSRAGWCCSETDGNSWFGDTYFDPVKWRRGLAFMAKRAQFWPNLLMIGLRNELRHSRVAPNLAYNFGEWYKNMVEAAHAIHSSNPNIVMFFGGLNFSETLAPIPFGLPLDNNTNEKPLIFDPAKFAWKDKIVLELHIYTMSDRVNTGKRHLMNQSLYDNGFAALDESNPSVIHHFPVVMSEWGITQDKYSLSLNYTRCIRGFLTRWDAGWMNWSVAGSFMVRSGQLDSDDTWGMLNHDWTDWRSHEFIDNFIKPFVQETLEPN